MCLPKIQTSPLYRYSRPVCTPSNVLIFTCQGLATQCQQRGVLLFFVRSRAHMSRRPDFVHSHVCAATAQKLIAVCQSHTHSTHKRVVRTEVYWLTHDPRCTWPNRAARRARTKNGINDCAQFGRQGTAFSCVPRFCEMAITWSKISGACLCVGLHTVIIVLSVDGHLFEHVSLCYLCGFDCFGPICLITVYRNLCKCQ